MKAIKGVSDAFWLGGGYHWEDDMWVLNYFFFNVLVQAHGCDLSVDTFV